MESEGKLERGERGTEVGLHIPEDDIPASLPQCTDANETPLTHSHDDVSELKTDADILGSAGSQDSRDLETSCNENQEILDPYFYTRGKEFTSEIFKIELLNLPNYVGYTQLKKLLTSKLKLKPHKIKLISQTPPTVFVTFRCEEDREAALNALANFKWKGRLLHAKKANPSADPLVKKRKKEFTELDTDDCCPLPKLSKAQDDVAVDIRMKQAVTPLWDVPYPEQLKIKQQAMRDILMNFTQKISAVHQQMKRLFRKRKEEFEGLCCPLLSIRPSPVENAYRNKCEFNVGLHPETGLKSVGFRIGSYKAGSKCVVPPNGLPNLPSVMLLASECFLSYIENSKRDVFNQETNTGHWRQLTVRNASSHLMLIFGMHPQDMTQEELSNEKADLLQYFGPGGPGAKCCPTSLYFQQMGRKVSEDLVPKPELLWGEETIEELLLGMHLKISPNAFFQVNTSAAEVLYRTVAEMAEIDSDTAVVDLCCGTGAIGLFLAQQAREVVGIELCREAVADARSNAERNGVTNIKFICGKAEDFLADVLGRLSKHSSIVAIVDPPRAGLHNRVVQCIRSTETLRRLVYVSCSPRSVVNNFVDLCRPTSGKYRLKPFVPVRAVPVDLFPHTHHCELAVLFER